MSRNTLSVLTFAGWLSWLGWLVLIGGWAAAIAVFFIVGDQTCATVEVPLGAEINVCQDSAAEASILLVLVGFGGTVSALFLWTFRYLLRLLHQIEVNTGSGNPESER